MGVKVKVYDTVNYQNRVAVYGLEAARGRLAELAAGLSREASRLEGAGGVLDGLVAYVARRDR